MKLVNWGILKQPMNWLTIPLMLLLAAMVGTLVLRGAGLSPAQPAAGN